MAVAVPACRSVAGSLWWPSPDIESRVGHGAVSVTVTGLKRRMLR